MKKEKVEIKHTNHLAEETSPYLLMHAHNPVDWYPWGEKAFAKAKKENKPLLISIGYAACHWCHVMEKESFEDLKVAELMNKYFVCIKVDREERPDVDGVYMDAAQLLTGRGGWPLNAFALPDGKPFYAGTYFPKENWLELLEQIHDVYTKQKEKVENQAKSLTEGIRAAGLVKLNNEKPHFTMADLDAVFSTWESKLDYQWGGTQSAPKFPVPIGYCYLLKYYGMTGNKKAGEAVRVTLDNMAMGGIYDQVGGGFARYSTDRRWKIPHFEKMLYDNGQLVSLYSTAFQAFKEPLYKQVVYETLEFIGREMTTPVPKNGGLAFYSSLDADSEGEEGKFYTWEMDELKKFLGEKEATFMAAYYNATTEGNWEEKNILFRRQTDDEFAAKQNTTRDELQKRVKAANGKLLEARAQRVRPPLDDKILTAWNALMLTGYVDAYLVFENDDFLDTALKNADFILTHMMEKNGSLKRNYKVGGHAVAVNGFLDDYAFTIQAFMRLYRATFEKKWLERANTLTEYTMEHFFHRDSGMFYYDSNLNSGLVARKMETDDNVIPASNSQMARNLYLLGTLLGKGNYIETSKRMLNNMKAKVAVGGPYFSNWAYLMSYFVEEPFEVAIVGEDCLKVRKELDKHFLPNAVILGGKTEVELPLLKDKLVKGQTTIYVCKNKACMLPVTEAAKALEQMR
ncbi:MAG: thioredoxin domain-containing protein [bacterium]|nr:thioredoxin domain-containing protein [bacterium]